MESSNTQYSTKAFELGGQLNEEILEGLLLIVTSTNRKNAGFLEIRVICKSLYFSTFLRNPINKAPY